MGRAANSGAKTRGLSLFAWLLDSWHCSGVSSFTGKLVHEAQGLAGTTGTQPSPLSSLASAQLTWVVRALGVVFLGTSIQSPAHVLRSFWVEGGHPTAPGRHPISGLTLGGAGPSWSLHAACPATWPTIYQPLSSLSRPPAPAAWQGPLWSWWEVSRHLLGPPMAVFTS